MAENYLITGYWGEPHVTSENDRGINAAIFGAGRFVLPVGEQFRAEYIGNNTVRMYDGKLMDNGAVAGIPAGEYIDLLIPEAGQGMNRNDLIVFQYTQDRSTLIEKGVFMVLSGEETSGTAIDPELSQEDLLTNEATLDQMALWRVSVSSTVISDPVQLFDVSINIKTAGIPAVEAVSTDGVAYSATVPGVTELYAGLEITIVPNMVSATTAPTLNINGLGAKNIRLPVSTNTAMLAQPDTETYYVDGRPVKLIYDPKYAGKGSWVVVGRQRQTGSDLYGSVPIEKGGTGADNATEARENLGAAPAGYGLGEFAPFITDANEAILPGFYRFDGTTCANAPSEWQFPYGTIIVSRGSSYIEQLFLAREINAKRTRSGETWGEWEYLNPPMNVGVEYRTIERWNGKPVYTKLVDLGALTATQVLTVETPGITALVRAEPVVNNEICKDWDEFCGGAASNKFYFNPTRGNTSIVFYVYCGENRVGKNLKAQVWYVK